jgi:hypothetical protein
MKYVYGTMFALLFGALMLLVLMIYAPVNASLITSILATILCLPFGVKLMDAETIRENLLDE